MRPENLVLASSSASNTKVFENLVSPGSSRSRRTAFRHSPGRSRPPKAKASRPATKSQLKEATGAPAKASQYGVMAAHSSSMSKPRPKRVASTVAKSLSDLQPNLLSHCNGHKDDQIYKAAAHKMKAMC